MNYRYLLLFFGVSVSVSFIYIFLNEKQVEKAIFVDYQNDLHKVALDELMIKNQFWLFHGEFDKSKIDIFKNIISAERKDDFNQNVMTRYYTKVALYRNTVVGFITYYISHFFDEKINEDIKIGRIHLLVIDSAYRKLGIGFSLVQEVMEFFKLQGCKKVYLVTRPENIRAKLLYYKFGFVEADRADFMDRIYDENPADYLTKDL